MGPFHEDDPHPEKSLFNLVLNLNKKGATVNLETTTGQAILKELVKHIDVIVESFHPGYLGSLGLGYDALQEINPSLVMTSITPFGQDGPYSQKAWKWVTSPSSFGLSYFPETTSKLCFNLRNCMKPNDTVINRPVPIKIIVRGRDIHPLNISVQ